MEIVSSSSRGQAKPVCVFLASKEPVVLLGLRQVFRFKKEFLLVGEACFEAGLVEAVKKANPDVILLQPEMFSQGFPEREQLLEIAKLSRVLLFTHLPTNQRCFVEAMRCGCKAALSMATAPKDILSVVHKVVEGQVFMDPVLTSLVMSVFVQRKQTERGQLTPRESQILDLVARGFKNREMAEKLFISEQTVKNHLHNIMEKLHVGDRLQLALYAVHNGFVSEQPAVTEVVA